MEKKAKRNRTYSFLLVLLLVVTGMFSTRINTDVYAKGWDCVVTDHEDPAMQYLASADEQEYAAQYIYIKVEGADYAVVEGDVMTEPNFQNKAPSVDVEKFMKMNGKAIYINGISLEEIYGGYDEVTRDACSVVINPLTRWGYIGIKLPTVPDYRDLLKLEVKKGCKFPSLASAQKGDVVAGKCYVNQETYQFIHDDMKSQQDVPDNAVNMSIQEKNIVFTIKLNRFLLSDCDGTFAKKNYDDVLLNGTPLSAFNDAKTIPASQWIAAKWEGKEAGDRLRLVITVPLSCSSLINAEYEYVGNHILLKKGMSLPASRTGTGTKDAGALQNSYKLGIYAEEVITEYYDENERMEDYGTNQVSGVTFQKNDGEGALIKVTFASAISNEGIPAEGDYHVIASEAAREKWGDGNVYSKPFYLGFMHDGLKSSVLDNIYINGQSLAQWQAEIRKMDESSVRWRAISIHYGELGGKVMTIHFVSDAVNTKQKLLEAYENGTMSIEFKPGVKFMTHSMVKTGQKFVYQKETESFCPATTKEDAKDLDVFYNGEKVENNSIIQGYGLIDKNSLYIPDDGNDYYVSFDTKSGDDGTQVNVTIYLDKKIVFAFTIKRS